MLLRSLQAASLIALSYAISPQQVIFKDSVRPLVIWHGLGDSHSSPGMLEFIELIKTVHPGIYVHSVYVEEDLKEDQRAGWFGDVNDQIGRVAAQLQSISELDGGFDAIGFSQGGQFLRAFTEFYNDPPVRNLITFGSQHMGIADFPGCKPRDFFCTIARNAASVGVYSEWAQTNLVQAQYYRSHRNLPQYLAHNKFLARLNNEVAPDSQNVTFADNLASLEHLVLVMFTEDKTVVPKESSWFGSLAPTSDGGREEEETIIPMRLQPIYLNDTIGLRSLDEAGRVHLVSCDGPHMRIARSCWEPLISEFVGSRSFRPESLYLRTQQA